MELIGRMMKKRCMDEGYYELEDLIIITPFRWPALGEWRQKFESLNYEPQNWTGQETLEIPPDFSEGLEYLGRLPLADRKMLLDPPYPMPKSQFVEKFGSDTLTRCLATGTVREVMSLSEKLQHLPLAELRVMQKALSLRGGRSRADAAKQLTGACDEETLRSVIPPRYREPMMEVVPKAGLPPRDWIFSRRMLAKLYLITLSTSFCSMRSAEASLRLSIPLRVLDQNSHCPVCRPVQGKKVELQSGLLPPYHPGCNCNLFVDVKPPS
ncbi:MAG: hypothetical protein ACE145_13915 [Terriglobia bacterium]